jgi:hypothetical protein
MARMGLGAASGASEGAANAAAQGATPGQATMAAAAPAALGVAAQASPYLASFAMGAAPGAAVATLGSHVPVIGHYLAYGATAHSIGMGLRSAAAASSSPGAAYLAASIGAYGNTPRTEREWQAAYEAKLGLVRQAAAYYGVQ